MEAHRQCGHILHAGQNDIAAVFHQQAVAAVVVVAVAHGVPRMRPVEGGVSGGVFEVVAVGGGSHTLLGVEREGLLMVVGQAAVGAAAGEVDASVASAVAHRTQPHGVGHVGRKAADNGRRGGEGVPHREVVARNADVERCPVALPVESERGAVDAHRHPVDQARLHTQVVEEKPRLARAAAHQHENHMLVQVAEYRAVVLPLFCLREE